MPPRRATAVLLPRDDFDAAVEQARGLVDTLELEPQINASTRTQEIALRDPDGYYVMLSANGGNR